MPEIITAFFHEHRPQLERLLQRAATAQPVQPEEFEPFEQEAHRLGAEFASWCLAFTNQDPRESLAFFIEAVGSMRGGCTHASQLELIWVVNQALKERVQGLGVPR